MLLPTLSVTAIGVLVGVLIDVMLADGIYVFIIGHAGAMSGAVVAVARRVREAHHTTA